MVEAIYSPLGDGQDSCHQPGGARVADEQLWPVPSAGHANPTPVPTRRRSSSSAPKRSCPVVSPDPVAVVEICRRLDGIPLAIELAASRMVSMTVTEVRDRLNDRFRLLVGSRRGLERHQTLRHAVQWSYDLLDRDEQTLLNRCSVFAGGFDLAGACAVSGSEDEFATRGPTRCPGAQVPCWLPTVVGANAILDARDIRQFAEDQPRRRWPGRGDTRCACHYFADREAEVLTLWDSPRQREAYDWFTSELANLRTAFRWAADRGDLDTAATIALYAIHWGLVEQYEPTAWAEELIEAAEAVQHPRLATLYVAAQCCWSGGFDKAVRYSENGQRLIGDERFDRFPFGYGAWLGAPYIAVGQPKRWADLARALLEHMTTGTRTSGRPWLCADHRWRVDEAMAPTDGLIDTAEATQNPHALRKRASRIRVRLPRRRSARRTSSPRPSVGVAQTAATGSSNPISPSFCQISSRKTAPQRRLSTISRWRSATTSTQVTSRHREVRWPSSPPCWTGSVTMSLRPPSPIRRERLTRMAFPEIATTIVHLREMLGDDRYESLAQVGKAMTNAAMANYALEQIDLARANSAIRQRRPEHIQRQAAQIQCAAVEFLQRQRRDRPSRRAAVARSAVRSHTTAPGRASRDSGPARSGGWLQPSRYATAGIPTRSRHPILRHRGRSCRSARRCL